jgi:long-subunit acyl-CoA synthetase (AMP-forming)
MSKIADRLILSKVREAVGLDKAHLCVTGSAPTPRSTFDFFVSLNLPFVEAYGMSEHAG